MENGVSMEEFGPVCVDYFNERRVTDVLDGKPGDGNPVWTIVYERGGRVHNFDPTIAKPTAIKGAAQTLVVFGTYNGQPCTELRFGLEVVRLNPTQYAMVDKDYTRGQMVWAQRSDANMVVTPPHPDERIAEGPDDGGE